MEQTISQKAERETLQAYLFHKIQPPSNPKPLVMKVKATDVDKNGRKGSAKFDTSMGDRACEGIVQGKKDEAIAILRELSVLEAKLYSATINSSVVSLADDLMEELKEMCLQLRVRLSDLVNVVRVREGNHFRRKLSHGERVLYAGWGGASGAMADVTDRFLSYIQADGMVNIEAASHVLGQQPPVNIHVHLTIVILGKVDRPMDRNAKIRKDLGLTWNPDLDHLPANPLFIVGDRKEAMRTESGGGSGFILTLDENMMRNILEAHPVASARSPNVVFAGNQQPKNGVADIFFGEGGCMEAVSAPVFYKSPSPTKGHRMRSESVTSSGGSTRAMIPELDFGGISLVTTCCLPSASEYGGSASSTQSRGDENTWARQKKTDSADRRGVSSARSQNSAKSLFVS